MPNGWGCLAVPARCTPDWRKPATCSRVPRWRPATPSVNAPSLLWSLLPRYRDKEGCVDLEFHPEMRPLLLSLKEYFCRIPMDVFFRIKNAHAAKFYLVCKSWDPNNAGNAAPGWRFTIDELRSWLWIQEDEYRHTPHLKSAVLERAKAELDEVADVSFEYEPFRQDGVIAGWDFTPV